mmetsp:Transcript_23759/g.34022  ORF Transcript_23759/g.34022 Transcript_23759/m.34022 type:complete len:128 (+) Transcript_23759:248-631(+)
MMEFTSLYQDTEYESDDSIEFVEDEKLENEEAPFVFFDFRRGTKSKFWPLNAELIDQNTTDSLIEKATKTANETRIKKNENRTEDVLTWSEFEVSPDECKKNRNDLFETLADGSTALILKPGFRSTK